MEKKERRYDIDWLRTLGVLLVIPFHSLIMFNMQPWSIVYIKDTINVRSFNILDSIIDRFHMPLLFVLAGMSVYLALQSRTARQFIDERFRKLFIPFIFGCIFLNPFMTYIYMVSRGQNSTYIKHLKGFFIQNPGDFTGLTGAFTPAHLWFILFLLFFSLAGLPLFTGQRKGAFMNLQSKFAVFFEKPLMLLFTVIPVAIISLIEILDDKNPLVYFSIFLIGFLLMTDERYQKAINRDKWVYLILSIILIYIKFTVPNRYEPWSVMWIMIGLMDKATRLVPVYAFIGIGNCYMNKNTKVLAYLSPASFPVYVIHMLINTIVGFFIIKLSMGPMAKLSLIVTVTYGLCFLLYEVIRHIKILSFVFGAKYTVKNMNNQQTKTIWRQP